MPQSFLVLIGMALVALITLQQVRSGHRTDTNLEHLTLQSAAADLAAERLAFLGALPFDEVVKTGRSKSAADLTPVVNGAFVRVLSPDPAGDDLDDFHGTQTTLTTALREGSAGQPLTAAITVRYVSEADGTTPSLVPTRLKRATVVVTTPGADPVRLSQVYSCAGYCTW